MNYLTGRENFINKILVTHYYLKLVFCHKNICFITLLLLRLFTFLVLRNVICIFIDHLNNESIKNDEKNMFVRTQKSFTMTKYFNFVHFRKFMMWFLFFEFYNPFIYFMLPFFCKKILSHLSCCITRLS